MTMNEIKHKLQTMPLADLKGLFCEQFNVSHLCLDLMDELSETKQRMFMKEKFLYEFNIIELDDILNN